MMRDRLGQDHIDSDRQSASGRATGPPRVWPRSTAWMPARKILGEIGRAVGAEADDGRGQRRQAEADLGQTEIEDEELGQRRRAADELDIRPGWLPQEARGGTGQKRERKASHQGQGEGAQRDLDRHG